MVTEKLNSTGQKGKPEREDPDIHKQRGLTIGQAATLSVANNPSAAEGGLTSSHDQKNDPHWSYNKTGSRGRGPKRYGQNSFPQSAPTKPLKG